MKKTKKFVAAVALALAVTLLAVTATACGNVTLDEGEYTGTYKCTTTVDGAVQYWGFTATFTVDKDNLIWDLAFTNPAADWEGAPENATYQGSLGQRPWDPGKVAGQFSGKWTVSEFMSIKVAVDANGYPSGEDCITSNKDITVAVGFEPGTAIAILAVQNAVNTALGK